MRISVFSLFFLFHVFAFSQTDPVAAHVSTAHFKDVNGNIHLVGSDKEGGALTYTIVRLPSHGDLKDPLTDTVISAGGTLSSNGNQLTFVPHSDENDKYIFSGTTFFTYKVTDDTSRESETMTVTVKVFDTYYHTPPLIGSEIPGQSVEDNFGRAVSLSEDGTIMAVGAPQDDDGGGNAGSVKVYQFSGGSWSTIGNQINGASAGDKAGSSVSLSGDGTILAVGLPYNDTNIGQVKIFKYDGSSNWDSIGTITPVNVNSGASKAVSEQFGNDVRLSSDGKTLAVSDIWFDRSGRNDAGRVVVYRYDGTNWNSLGNATALYGESGDNFSWGLSLSANGNIMAIGAHEHDKIEDGSTKNAAGKVIVYKYNGTSWDVFDQVFNPGGAGDLSASSDRFGGALDLSSNGLILAVGAPYDNPDGTVVRWQGTVNLFYYNGTKYVPLGTEIKGDAKFDYFGAHLSLDNEGNTLAVMAPGYGTDQGQVKVYNYNTGTSEWEQSPVSYNFDGEEDDNQSSGSLAESKGQRVFLSGDGSVLAIGADLNNSSGGTDSGHVKVHRLFDVQDIPVADDKTVSFTLYEQQWSSEEIELTGSDTVGDGDIDRGITTGAAANKLIEAGQNFTSTVSVGNKVISKLDGQTALVTAVDSDTQLTLDTDIMISGEAYTIDIVEADLVYIITELNTSKLREGGTEIVSGDIPKTLTGKKVEYNSNSDVAINDSFKYIIHDGKASSVPATVSLTIVPDNDPPVASAVADQATDENTAKENIILAGTDVDNDDTNLNFLIYTVPTNGTLVDANNGNSAITVEEKDSGTTDGVEANKLVDSTQDFATTVQPGDFIHNTTDNTYADIKAVDSNTKLSISADIMVSGETYTIKRGTSLTVDTGTAKVTYTPNNTYSGSDTFAFKARDKGLKDEIGTDVENSVDAVSVSITVNNTINDAPVAQNGTISTNEETESGAITLIATDPDDLVSDLTFTITENVSNGKLKDGGTEISTFPHDLTGILKYTPNDNFIGDDTFKFTAKDDGDPIAPVKTSNEAVFTISVADENDPPVADAQSLTTAEETETGTITLVATDVDDDDTTLSYTIKTNAANGKLKDGGTEISTFPHDITGALTYLPNTDFNGDDTFTFTAKDDENLESNAATVTVTVSPSNDPPVADAQSLTTAEETETGTITLVATDVDDDDTTLSYTIKTNAVSGKLKDGGTEISTFPHNITGALTYLPNTDFDGNDTFTFTAKDDDNEESNTATVTITVTNTNDPPVANSQALSAEEETETGTITLVATDVDDDDTTLSYTIKTNAVSGKLKDGGTEISTFPHDITGALTYLPNTDFNGDDTFTFTAKDDDAAVSNTATVTITVNEFNDPPTADDQTITDLAEQTPITITLTGSDAETANLTYIVTVLPTDGTLSENGNIISSVPKTIGSTSFLQMGPDFKGGKEGSNSNYLGFGQSSMSSDGTKISFSSYNGTTGKSLVKIFSWDGTTWTQIGSDIIGDDNGDEFGAYNSLSSDGTIIAIGAAKNDAGGTLSGQVKVFKYNGTDWLLVGAVINGDNPGDYLGSVSLSSDGTKLAVGAPNKGGNNGQVVIYNWDGSAWNPLGSEINGASSNEFFGSTVHLSANGERLAIGARESTNLGGAATAGHVGVYDWNGTDWNLVGDKIEGVNQADGENQSVFLSKDGSTLAVGSGDADSAGNVGKKYGKVRVYKYNGTSWDKTGDLDGNAEGNNFGNSVGLSSDGKRLIAGSWLKDKGAISIYDYSGASWTKSGADQLGNVDQDRFGAWVYISDDGKKILSSNNPIVSSANDFYLKAFEIKATLGNKVIYTGTSETPTSDLFKFKTRDEGAKESSDATVSITFLAVNDPPVAQDEDLETDEDVEDLAVTLKATDVDDDDSTLVYTILTETNNGVLKDDTKKIETYPYTLSGTLTFTPEKEWNGDSTFTFKATDDEPSDSNTATIKITVKPVNDPPTADDQDLDTEEETPLDITLTGNDVDKDVLTYRLITLPDFGILKESGTTLDAADVPKDLASSDLKYVPEKDYNGLDSFTFSVKDDDCSATKTSTLNVTGDFNDSVTGSNTLTIPKKNIKGSQANPGTTFEKTVNIKLDIGKGDVFQSCEVKLDVKSFDDGLTFSINGTKLLFFNQFHWDKGQGANTTEFNRSSNGKFVTRAAGDWSPWYGEGKPKLEISNGKIKLMVDTKDGGREDALQYMDKTVSDWVLADSFSYDCEAGFDLIVGNTNHGGATSIDADLIIEANLTPCNGLESDPATIKINVVPFNDPPVANPQTVTVIEDSIDGSITLTGSDPESQPLTYIVTALTNNGVLKNDGTPIIDSDLPITLLSSAITYSPNADYNGNDAFTFKVNDAVKESNTAIVSIIVTPVNDPPESDPQTVNTDQETSVDITHVGRDKDLVDVFTVHSQMGKDIQLPQYWGEFIELSADGKTMVIGGWINNKVKVYGWDGTAWNQLGSDIDGSATGDYFGEYVSISSNGKRIAVGAHKHGSEKGQVRAFDWDGTSWTQLGNEMLGSSSKDNSSYRGIHMSGDGNVIAAASFKKGYVDTYKWDGTSWNKTGVISNTISNSDAPGQVSLSNNGDRLAIGSSDGGGGKGQVKIFDWDGTNTWNQYEAIDGKNAGEKFGNTLSITRDGKKIAVGVYGAGSARVYDLSGSNATQVGADINYGNGAAWRAISLSDDGNRIAIPITNQKTGVFDWNGTSWNKLGEDLIKPPASPSLWGESLDMSSDGKTLVIGGHNGFVQVFNILNLNYIITTYPSNGILKEGSKTITKAELPYTLEGTDATYVPNLGFYGEDEYFFKLNDGKSDSTNSLNDKREDSKVKIIIKEYILELPSSNYKITTTETCKGFEYGVIDIEVTETSYKITPSGNDIPITYNVLIDGKGLVATIVSPDKTAQIKDLAGGTYKLSFTVQGQPKYLQKFDVVIEEPNPPIAYPVDQIELCDDNVDGEDDNGKVNFDTSLILNKLLTDPISGNIQDKSLLDIEFTYFDETSSAIVTKATLPSPFYSATQTVQVKFTSVVNGSCQGTQTIDFKVNPVPVFERIENTISVCSNLDPVTIGVKSSDSNVYSYTWTRNGTVFPPNIEGVDSSILIGAGGEYVVTATTKDGSNCSKSMTITIKESSIATIAIEDITIKDLRAGPNNSITISLKNLGIGDYEFAIDDVIGPYQDEPIFEKVRPGKHTIYVRDKNQCGTAKIDVWVIGYKKFFTPNGDGYTDTWNIIGITPNNLPKSKIYLFDRYEKFLKELDPLSPGWDGTFNGKPMPQTDYWFRAILEDGREFKGHFSLIRGW